MLRLVTVIGVLGGVSTAMAEPVRMTGEDIRRAMPGALLEIDTPLRIAIPVKVGTDGLMSAEAGALGLTLGATKDRGRWWADGDKLCMKWFRWFDAKPRCMTLHRDGNRVNWAEGSGESGTATITEAKPIVAAVEPPPIKKTKPAERPETAVLPVEETQAAVQEPDALAIRKPFATAALSQMFTSPEPDKPDPQMLGMGESQDARPAPVAEPAAPPRIAQPAPVRKKKIPVASAAPAAVHAATKSARHAPAAPKAASASKTLVSFRVAGVGFGDTLNVRSGPSEYHSPVGTISSEGRGVQIIGTCRELWCPIRHGRLTGWVNRYYLAEDGVQRASARR